MQGQEQQNYSDRDLLIVLNERMDTVLKRLQAGGDTIRSLELKVKELETRLNVYIAIASLLGGILGSIISKTF